ncbi:MAG: hypothetical protein K9J13_11810 [Saprospiraceae bacterium]|nr:hypothetical protein [Saprospiraceae bacterium]
MKRLFSLIALTVIILAAGILHSEFNIGLGLDFPAAYQSKSASEWGYTRNSQTDSGYETFAEYLQPLIKFRNSTFSAGAGAAYIFALQSAYDLPDDLSYKNERYGFIPLYLVGQYSNKMFYGKLKGGYNIFYANEEITDKTKLKNGIYAGLSGGLNLPFNTFLELSYQYFTGGFSYEYHSGCD